MSLSNGRAKNVTRLQSYEGNISEAIIDQCTAFSNIMLVKRRDAGLDKPKVDKVESEIKSALKTLKDVFTQSGNSAEEFIKYLEFLIKHKGNVEFTLPCIYICNISGHDIDQIVATHHHGYSIIKDKNIDQILGETFEDYHGTS